MATDGAEVLRGSAGLLRDLGEHADRPLVAYLQKSALYYVFLACSFLNRLDFCPLDSENPVQRVLDVAAQLSKALILCDTDEAFACLRERTAHCLKIGLSTDEVPAGGGERRNSASYYIATSGSTGTPKLVQVPQDRTIPFIDWAIPFYGIHEGCRWAQFSSIGFDLSLVDFLSVVCGSGTLISLTRMMDRIRPAMAVIRGRITHWHSVPSMIPYFLREPGEEETVSACRLFTFCGEPAMRADADGLAERYPGARIINTYGPTEDDTFLFLF